MKNTVFELRNGDFKVMSISFEAKKSDAYDIISKTRPSIIKTQKNRI